MGKVSKKPSVSVVVATYNGEKYIYEQLCSIINNIGINDEIIITDDGSTDDTLNIINNIKDNRIKIFDGPRMGVQQNFAYGLTKCKGKYLFFSDQDDVWIDDKINLVIKIFESENCLCVVHDATVMNKDLTKTIYKSYFDYRKAKKGFMNNLIKPNYLGCCMAIKREALKYILPIPSKIEMHDRWIGSICDFIGKTFFFDKVLIKYRRHDNNVSKMKRNSIPIIIKNRIYLLLNLLTRVLKKGRI